MTKYEFKLVHRQVGNELKDMLAEMNALGQEGWYCVTQWLYMGWDYVMMQREVPAVAAPRPHSWSLGECMMCGTKEIDQRMVPECPGLGGTPQLAPVIDLRERAASVVPGAATYVDPALHRTDTDPE